jgi:hypothetical protein
VVKRLSFWIGASAFAAFVWATAALAGSGSSLQGYNRTAGVAAHVQSGGQVSGASNVGSLPFTGLDLGILAAVGVILVFLGWRLRRSARRAS